MDDKELNREYQRIIRQRPQPGAKKQRTKEIYTHPCGESSPYHQWESKHIQTDEHDRIIRSSTSAFGDPDEFPYAEGRDIQSATLAEETTNEIVLRVRKLLGIAKQILTQQQYNVFVLMAVKEPFLTVRETAKVLGIKKSVVGEHWRAARKKLQKAYE